MRTRARRTLAVLLVLFLSLAGCAEEASPPLDDPGSSAEATQPLLAFMDAPAERGGNRTLLALRADGAAERLTYLDDGSWLPRLAPGVEYDAEQLALLFADPTSVRERGGLVLRVERGRVSADALADLAPYLAAEWPEPFLPPGEPHPWYRPALYVRATPHATTESTSEGTEHLGEEDARLAELIERFDALAAAFVAESVTAAELPTEQAWDGCLQASTNVTPSAARAGEDVVEVQVTVTNCGDADATIDHADCASPPSLNVQVGGSMWPRMAVLPSTEEPRAAYALDLVCRGEGGRTEIAAGDTIVLTRRWNGTFGVCSTEGACEYRPAPAAQYGMVAFPTGQREALPAGVTLVPPDAPTTRFLLARERDTVSTAGSGHLRGDFGPHCAPVGYTLDPATVTVWYSETKPPVEEGVVVRDWRGSPRPDHVSTLSADRLDLVPIENGTATLASPFRESLALAEVRLEGEDFVVNGTRIPPGGTHTLRAEHVFEEDGTTFETTSEIELENVGEAAILWARAGGCA